jgi:hypothetical protein
MLMYKQRPEQNEISLALVPRDHPLIPPSDIEAETSGLLDRILDILSDKSRYIFLQAYDQHGFVTNIWQ